MAEKLLFVTGSNGFIGARIVELALQNGYHVRAGVRSPESMTNLQAAFSSSLYCLSFAIVPDITSPKEYATALDAVTAVVHAASPFNFTPTNNVEQLLEPAIESYLAILEATKRYGASVKRIVNISSFAAMVDFTKGLRPDHTYSEKDWNPMTFEQAANTRSGPAAMWRWMKDNQDVSFPLSMINPPWVFGLYRIQADLDHLCESMKGLWRLFGSKEVPPTDFAAFVDVRDVAEALMQALVTPSATGKRFLLGAHFDWQIACDIIRDKSPNVCHRIPEGNPGSGAFEAVYTIDSKQSKDILELKYTPLGFTLSDAVAQLLEAANASD